MQNYDACNWTNNHMQKNVTLNLELQIEQEKEQFFLLATHLYSQKGCAIETTVARTIITFSIELMVLMAVV